MCLSANFGVALAAPTEVRAAFFNRPNPLGVLDPARRLAGQKLAAILSAGGLETELVENIKLLV